VTGRGTGPAAARWATAAGQAEVAWIARATRAQVVMVPEAGHYPQSQRLDITSDAVLRFLATVHS
jgi:hypothetical protein